jgi:hypothetical protein
MAMDAVESENLFEVAMGSMVVMQGSGQRKHLIIGT